ncbi:MAG: hypothetical protein OSA98_15900 [Rubripirellula sp.]|nr:hypothetical protein [Rubripirellula sp.]
MKRLLSRVFACILLLSISHLATDQHARAQESAPSTSAALLESMKLTDAQQAEFKVLEQERKAAAAGFRGLTGAALRDAQQAYYAERRTKLKKIFTQQQWSLWSTFWENERNRNSPRTTSQPTGKPATATAPDLATIPVIGSAELDRFGGWEAKSFEATGFFRTHHDGSRWWLVTPEGHPFLSFGLNHFSPSHYYASYNRDHWVEQFGAEKPMTPKWRLGFRNEALALCQKLGITALGVNNDAATLTNPPRGAILPYVRRFLPLVLSHYTFPKAEQYHDVFAPEFVTHCEQVAREQAAPYKNDPMLIGYIMSDAARLTDLSVRGRPSGATTFPRVLRNLGSDAPGKQVYVKMMRQRHTDIATLNDSYGTTFNDWQSLTEAENWRDTTDFGNEVELADNAAFLSQCVGQYHKVARATLLKADPNHMFFGDKLGARGPTFDAVIEAAAPHVDVIQFGHYGRLSEQVAVIDRWTEQLKKPFISADGSFSVKTEMLPSPMGQGSSIAKDYPECSAWTRELAAGLFARGDVVGWNICGVIDVWKTAHGREKKQHQGIMDPFGKIHPGMESAIRDVSSRLYHIADSQNSAASATKATNPDFIGREGFVHVERKDGIWFMVNAEGECFVPTGMNHVGPMHRFAPYNRDFWLEQFGPEVFASKGQIDWKGPGVKRWMTRIAKDHKDHGFNTLAFHHPPTLPTEFCNELQLYYFGKIRMSHVHARRAKTMSPDKKFPDVFDPAWLTKLDAHVQKFTSRHKDSKYLLGYSYDDLPAYTINNLERRISGFEHHPWILDIISKPGMTRGKQVWIDILKKQYPTAVDAAKTYGLKATDWNEFADLTQWGIPKDTKQGFVDQAMMNAQIIESYLKAHHDAIRKHDPNHLILGDKIQNARAQPDWVWNIVRKYVDVIVIQDYDFFTPQHAEKLSHIHEVTGKPIINGDHSYGVLRPNMKAVKGVKVESAEAKGREYATYLRGIMNLPFMVGWQTCGYMETWEGTADSTGKQQTGFFDPFGEPIKEALLQAKAANEHAVRWHEQAGASDKVYSKRRK